MQTNRKSCDVFEWKDLSIEEDPEHYKKVLLDTKKKLDAAESRTELNELRRRILELEKIVAEKTEKLDVQKVDHERFVAGLKSRLGVYQKMVVCLVVLVVVLCVK